MHFVHRHFSGCSADAVCKVEFHSVSFFLEIGGLQGCRSYRRLCLVAFPSRWLLPAGLCLPLPVLSLQALSISEIHYKPPSVYCQEKSPRNTTQRFAGTSGAFSSTIHKGRGSQGQRYGGLLFPLRPPPLRQYITGLIFCQDFFLNFREFYSAIISPTVRTPSFWVLTCASICVVSQSLRLP